MTNDMSYTVFNAVGEVLGSVVTRQDLEHVLAAQGITVKLPCVNENGQFRLEPTDSWSLCEVDRSVLEFLTKVSLVVEVPVGRGGFSSG